jgi:sensor c-di-GMP phosphodiesterase-like protein
VTRKLDEVQTVSPRNKRFVVIFAGALLLGVPSAAFNYRLNGLAERQSQQEMNLAARRTIALAESRISRAIALLDDLASSGVNSCDPAHIEALRQATFATTPVKELSVVASDNSTLCSDLGGSFEGRTVVSSEPVARGRSILLEVIHLGDHARQMVRITRPGAGVVNGLSALIPIELFMPQVSTHGGPVSINARIRTRSGTIIGQTGSWPVSAAIEDDALVLVMPSERFSLDAILALSRKSIEASQNEYRALGAIVTGLLALIIFGVLLLLPKRQRENPIVAIEQALKAGEFVPYYQPVVDIQTGQLRGAEVLMRWRKPDGTIVLPGAFIPLAETSGLILDLTRALMRQVCREVGPTLARAPHLKIGFNLAARQFADAEIVREVSEIFNNSQLKLSQVVLEMTERHPIEDLVETRKVIAALQGLGVKIAIDDVGTGHSGLSYILKLGVDIIKIDKMFVDSIGIDRNATAIVETLIDLANNMRMEVVAEGVENFEQVIHLRKLGIRGAQGYVFAPALPCSSFLQLVEAIEKSPKMTAEERVRGEQSSRSSRVA